MITILGLLVAYILYKLIIYYTAFVGILYTIRKNYDLIFNDDELSEMQVNAAKRIVKDFIEKKLLYWK